MKVYTARKRMSSIMTVEELERIDVNGESDRGLFISCNPHGYETKKAQRFVRNIINVNRDDFVLEVIHGYVHGTSIKEMIRKSDLSKRVKSIKSPSYNPGVTILEIDAA